MSLNSRRRLVANHAWQRTVASVGRRVGVQAEIDKILRKDWDDPDEFLALIRQRSVVVGNEGEEDLPDEV